MTPPGGNSFNTLHQTTLGEHARYQSVYSLSSLCLWSSCASLGRSPGDQVRPDDPLVRPRITCLASCLWLRREAPFAMLGSVMVSPALFSAWQLTQFDTLAAGALLFACALLTREHLCIWRRVLIAALLSLPLFLKESSALTAFGFWAPRALSTGAEQPADGQATWAAPRPRRQRLVLLRLEDVHRRGSTRKKRAPLWGACLSSSTWPFSSCTW